MTTLLKGTALAKQIKEETKHIISMLPSQITLAIIQVGDDEAAKVYTNSIKKLAQTICINILNYPLPKTTPQEDLLTLITTLNKSNDITGIFMHMPLPEHLNSIDVISTIDYKKDVDCITPHNIGLLSIGGATIFPCTPYGVMELLAHNNIHISKKDCVIIGRSLVVGKPLATLMLAKDATVTKCHSQTQNLTEITKRADIVITAVGHSNFLNKDMVKHGAIVIDIGINVDNNGNLTGDANFNEIKDLTSYITPVPGGVGPMTVAMLGKNILSAYYLQK